MPTGVDPFASLPPPVAELARKSVHGFRRMVTGYAGVPAIGALGLAAYICHYVTRHGAPLWDARPEESIPILGGFVVGLGLLALVAWAWLRRPDILTLTEPGARVVWLFAGEYTIIHGGSAHDVRSISFGLSDGRKIKLDVSRGMPNWEADRQLDRVLASIAGCYPGAVVGWSPARAEAFAHDPAAPLPR